VLIFLGIGDVEERDSILFLNVLQCELTGFFTPTGLEETNQEHPVPFRGGVTLLGELLRTKHL
jgi:hypothetical protein